MTARRGGGWRHPWRVLADFSSVLGFATIFTTLLEFFPSLSPVAAAVKSGWGLFAVVVASLIYTLVLNWPRKSFIFKVANRDTSLELRIGDIMRHQGSIVVPTNTDFDLQLNGNAKAAKSVQSAVVQRYFGSNSGALTRKINQELKKSLYDVQRAGTAYKVGTTVSVPCEGAPDRVFYFVANSHRNSVGSRVEAREADLAPALSGLWSHISEHGAKGEIAIPLLGTGQGRLHMSREDVFKEIARSFVASCAGKTYCNKLTIYIRQEDIDTCCIAIEELIEFAKFQALYVDYAPVTPARYGVVQSA